MGKCGESPVGLGCSVKAEETRSKIWVQVVYGEVDPRKHSHLPTLSSETSPQPRVFLPHSGAWQSADRGLAFRGRDMARCV